MNLALVITSDRGDRYLPACLESARAHLPWDQFTHRVVVDDSGELNPAWPDDCSIVAHENRRGLAAAIQSGWGEVEGADWIFHLEEDFVFEADIDLEPICTTLQANPRLCQMVLKRQPVSPEERQAGSVIGLRPNDYYDRWNHLEHDIGFSLNPCVIPGWVLLCGWPDGGGETEFNACLPSWARFGVWGQRDDPPLVAHLGERSPAWRL